MPYVQTYDCLSEFTRLRDGDMVRRLGYRPRGEA